MRGFKILSNDRARNPDLKKREHRCVCNGWGQPCKPLGARLSRSLQGPRGRSAEIKSRGRMMNNWGSGRLTVSGWEQEGRCGGQLNISWADVGMGNKGWLSLCGEGGGLRGHSRNTHQEYARWGGRQQTQTKKSTAYHLPTRTATSRK